MEISGFMWLSGSASLLKEYTGLLAQIQKTRQFLVISLFHQVYHSCIQRLPVILTSFGGYFK